MMKRLWQKAKRLFVRRVRAGELLHRRYGIVYHDFARLESVAVLVPFHFPLRTARALYYWFLWPYRGTELRQQCDKLQRERNEYQRQVAYLEHHAQWLQDEAQRFAQSVRDEEQR